MIGGILVVAATGILAQFSTKPVPKVSWTTFSTANTLQRPDEQGSPKYPCQQSAVRPNLKGG